MRTLQRIDLINNLAEAVNNRFGWDDMETYLQDYGQGLGVPDHLQYEDALVYAKICLKKLPGDKLIAIADELQVPIPSFARSGAVPPKCWPDDKVFRLFISHVAAKKDLAMKLRVALAPYGISGFVAHEDIEPKSEWKLEIERALSTMDGFVSMHTPGFNASVWTQQEIGFAVCRGVSMIALRMREDPKGLIDGVQCLLHRDRLADEIAKEVFDLFIKDPLTSERLQSVQPKPPSKSWNDDDEIPF